MLKKRNKKIFYAKHSINKADIKSVINSLKNQKITQGNEVLKFEKNINKYFKSKYSAVTTNGTAALHLSGMALNWKKKDIVIAPPLTFVSTVNSIIYSKAKPEFIDIDIKSYTIDVNKLEDRVKKIRKLNNFNLSTVIGVDYAGLPCDWVSLRYLADKYNFYLLNDNCHALGSKYKKDVGYAVKYADVVTHSYHAAKNFTTGEGGAVLSNNKKIIEKIKILRSHGLHYNSKKYWRYSLNEIGYNYRLTDFQCALGNSQLSQLNKFISTRRKNASIYLKYFKNNINYILPDINNESYHSFHFFPLRIKILTSQKNKDIFMKKLIDNNIYLQVHYNPVFMFDYYKKKFNFDFNKFKNTIQFYNQEVSLPTYPSLTSKDILMVIKSIDKVVNEFK